MKNPTIHPYRVLVADDQADIRDALRLLLKRENYETQSAASPAEALAAIESRAFDAVLIDLNYARDTTFGPEGGPRFHSETLGQCAAIVHPAHPDRPSQRIAAGLAAGGRESAAPR